MDIKNFELSSSKYENHKSWPDIHCWQRPSRVVGVVQIHMMCGTNIHVWYIHNTQDVTLALLSSHWSPAPMSLISAAALYLVINSLPPLTPTDCSTLLLNAKTLQIYLGLVCTLYMQQKTWKAKIINPSPLNTLASTGEKHSTLPLPLIIKSLYHGTFWVDSKFLPLKSAPPYRRPSFLRCKALLWSGHRASPPSFQIWGHKSQIWGHLSWMRRSRWGRTCSFAPKAGGRQIKSGFTHNFTWCGWHHNIWQGWTGKIGRRKSHRYGCTYTPMVWRMDWDWFEIRITSSRDNIFA